MCLRTDSDAKVRFTCHVEAEPRLMGCVMAANGNARLQLCGGPNVYDC